MSVSVPKINVLPAQLVNRIAAGEVVERPASVVKELMENSIDAGADKITLEIRQGGRELIRITDNGCGIPPEQLPLAFTAHATSKIATDQDLFSIHTMGFRGEALASIASISQVEMISCAAGAVEGARMEINAGQSEPPVPAPAQPGTTIIVRNLFFNTPARRKFLRAVNTEMSHITEQFTRIALAHTNLHLTLIHNDRTLHDLPPQPSLPARIETLFSCHLVEGLFPISRKEDALEITGLIGHPQLGRKNTQWQYIFLNGRYIRDRYIAHAIREAYRGMMEIHHQPVAFLFLKVPPDAVDVNVHPMKTEVRFTDSNHIHSAVLAAIRDRLLNTNLTVNAQSQKSSFTDKTDLRQSDEYQQQVRSALTDFFSGPASAKSHPKAFSGSGFNSGYYSPVIARSETPPPEQAASADPEEQETLTQDSVLPRVVQIHNTYILVQSNSGFEIIDQHALHERILYEKLSRQLAHGPLASQRCLIPEVVDLTPSQMQILETHQKTLEQLGLSLEAFGPTSLAVQSLPLLLDRANPAQLVRDLLDSLAEISGAIDKEELTHHILDTMACKAAVKAGDPLSGSEIQALLAQRELVERAGSCPHGRPTTINLTIPELEKMFKRT